MRQICANVSCGEVADQLKIFRIPGIVFAIFQMMFAAITPLLITGGIAERMKFNVYLIFLCCWEFFVYDLLLLMSDI